MANDKKPMTLSKCEIMQRLEYLTEATIIQAIEKQRCITKWCYILHDKDRYTAEDYEKNPEHEIGELKPPHWHIFLQFSDEAGKSTSRNIEQIAKWFGVDVQYVNKIKSSKFEGGAKYCVHFGDNTKYQYDVKEVRSNFPYEAMLENLRSDKRRDEIVKAINDGIITMWNRTTHLSIYEYCKYKKDIDNAFKYVNERELNIVDRNMEVIYIQGVSEAGKTTYAKKICMDKGLVPFISDGGENLLDNYRGQPAIILDDLRGSSMRFSDLLKLLDNHSCSTAKARYYNKCLANVKLIVITTVMDISTFFNTVFEHEEEPIVQLKRRCKMYIKLRQDDMDVLMYDAEKRDYTYMGTAESPVKDIVKSAIMSDDDKVDYVKDMLGISFPKNSVNTNDFVQMDVSMYDEIPFSHGEKNVD